MTNRNSSVYVKLWLHDANGNPHRVRRLVTVLAGENCQRAVSRQPSVSRRLRLGLPGERRLDARGGEPMSRAPGNKGRKYPAEPMSRLEVEALIKACSKRAPTGIRNAALIALLWRTGLRISEALSIKPKDIDGERQSLRVLKGKGAKARTVSLDGLAAASLSRSLDKRQALGINGHSPVFCTLKGVRLRDNYVRALLPRLAAKAGIEKRVHPHGLRHTFAFELANERAHSLYPGGARPSRGGAR